MNKNSNLSILANGILKENPVFILILGTCPTLATTTKVFSAFGMGIAALFVLVCSNFLISLLRKVIPSNVRIPCYIVIIAGFVTIIEMLIHAFLLPLYDELGIYIPLIVVNCIILARAEAFASKNTVAESVLDGIGMGLGFTIALVIIATFREILGSGTWCGIPVTTIGYRQNPALMFILPAGGFLSLGLILGAINLIKGGKENA